MRPTFTAFTILLADLAIMGIPLSAFARPEYAAKEKVSCASCHETPWGGGPRTVYGKVYGTHGLPGSLTTFTDVFYGDLRGIAFYPFTQTSQRTNGTALMEAAASANVPVVKGTSDQSEVRVVATYNDSSLAGSNLREAYVRYRPGPPGAYETVWTLGHIDVPFGLLTDEHRTYTRIQTNMTLNNYDTGGAFSRDFPNDFHLDVALVNDFQTGGSFTTTGMTYGTVGNLRWNPASLPFLLGLSATYQHDTIYPAPYAGSFYGVLSLDRLTDDKISASLSFESVVARNWNNPGVNTGGINPSLAAFFLPNTSFDAPYLTTTSFGNTGLAKYWLNPHWYLLYKFDYFALDARNLGSSYTRHGIGSEIWVNPNLSLSARVEFATTPHLGGSAFDPSLAAENDFFTMFRLWI